MFFPSTVTRVLLIFCNVFSNFREKQISEKFNNVRCEISGKLRIYQSDILIFRVKNAEFPETFYQNKFAKFGQHLQKSENSKNKLQIMNLRKCLTTFC